MLPEIGPEHAAALCGGGEKSRIYFIPDNSEWGSAATQV